jgi:hypothetical protein
MSEITIKIHDIVKELLESDPNLLDQKGHVADILEIPRAESKQIIKLHDVAFKSSYDFLSEFLVIWVGRQDSNNATIGLLSSLLEENGFIAAAGESIYYCLKYGIFSE